MIKALQNLHEKYPGPVEAFGILTYIVVAIFVVVPAIVPLLS